MSAPDWHGLVRARLHHITGDAARDEDIVEELAQDLAERYDDLRRGGLAHDEAVAGAAAQLERADELARALAAADRPRPLQPTPPPSSHLLADLWQDLEYGARTLARSPRFSIPAILTLIIGIGMTTAIFSVVDAVLLRPAPFPDADRLVMVWGTDDRTKTSHEPASFPDFVDFAERVTTIETIGAFSAGDANLLPEGGEPARIALVSATPPLLALVGATPIVGRLFTEDDSRAGRSDIVVISDRLWERVFHRDPAAVGRTVRIDDRLRTVIGVVGLQADFGVLQILKAADYARNFAARDVNTRVDVWAPFPDDVRARPRTSHGLMLVGRLAPGASVGAAREELSNIALELEASYPDSNQARGAFVERLNDVVFGPIEPAMRTLLAAVSAVLLIACVNVANLLLVRRAGRLREVAIRSAIGADLGRLARQFAAENALLTFVAAAIGTLVMFAAVRALLTMAPADIPRVASAGLDVRALAVAGGISILAAIVFGLMPVVQARRADLVALVSAEGSHGGTAARPRTRLRSVLVVLEVALAVMLVVCAGLLIKSFWRLSTVDPGFDAERVLKAEFQLPSSRYPLDFRRFPEAPAVHGFNGRLLDGAGALPGVESAALAVSHPLDGGFATSFIIVGRENQSRNLPEIPIRSVTPSYFQTLRVPLVSGRLIGAGDGPSSPLVANINEVAARRFFPGEDPIGRQIGFWGRRRTIVGVVGSERFQGVANAPPIAVYVSLAQAPSANGSEALLLRASSGDPAALAPAARGIIRDIDPGLAVFAVEPLAATLSASIGEQRFLMVVVGLFAATALILAAIGIHGVLSYTVAQQTREIGIRMALGAPPRRVASEVLRRSAMLAATGLVIGLALGYASARLLASRLFDVSPGDVAIFAAVVGVLAGAAAVATWLPVRRAVRVNPLTAIRIM